MEINKIINGNDITIEVSGRIDSKTNSELETVMNEVVTPESNLVVDFKNLEFISSAGLRTLIATQKKLNNKDAFVIKNVNDVVYEVFQITGFVKFLKIEKA